MNPMSFLDCADPRLGIRMAEANPADMTTRVAIRVLLDALASPEDRAVCAPAFGLPVRVLGFRKGDDVVCLLNPRIAGIGPLHVSQGETTPHTGDMRRSTMRALTLVVEGTGLSGLQQSFELADRAALGAQQAFDLMDQPKPFAWMTPFHHLWHRIRGSAQERRFAEISAGLFSATADTPVGLRRGEGDEVHLLADDGSPLAVVDCMNPMVPTRPLDRLALALLLAMTGMRTIMIADPGKIGLAVAATLVSPAATVLVAGCPFPHQAVDRLGLSGCIGARPFGIRDFPQEKGALPELDALLVNIGMDPDPPFAEDGNLAAIARALSGTSGALLILAPAEDARLEDRLKQHFASVSLVVIGDGTVVYAARKSGMDPDAVRARLVLAATKIGAGEALLHWLGDIRPLGKDGSRGMP